MHPNEREENKLKALRHERFEAAAWTVGGAIGVGLCLAAGSIYSKIEARATENIKNPTAYERLQSFNQGYRANRFMKNAETKFIELCESKSPEEVECLNKLSSELLSHKDIGNIGNRKQNERALKSVVDNFLMGK